ncbi:MAG: hypothetical protein KatS3mg115_1193 [Candidatus Poribacteria bacterium]|nr:MAG: hypothetical protein KatS3mg115_1193 [Candidatus Poribacteria bacterium]
MAWRRSASPGLLERITERPALRLVGLWTHFACAEDPLNPFTWEQYDRFLRATGDGFPQAIRHVANSAAALNFPKLGLDAVRAGLALYGIYPGPNVRRAVPLRPALSWKATVLRVAELQAGEGVSYAPRFRTDRPRQIATLSVGYADGYRRTAMGRSWVLIQGRRAPVVGTVCMDAVVCDITEIPGVRPGTVATLLGSDGKEALTAEELARQWGTIPYEGTDRHRSARATTLLGRGDDSGG